ncbi:hypothetical protein RUM43_000178 [Polyplax serrata]|uniref:c-SKI SMAD4-binding domain-containing protein n=1 Tax=Polyplax serrata TaxID=468196 RepID=A0AAN8XMP8_POLSC
MDGLHTNSQISKQKRSPKKTMGDGVHTAGKQNQVGTVMLYGIPIVSLVIESQERLCLAQISNTLLKQYSYNEIHNRRVALGITCVQCTPVQLEILRRAGAMPVSSRRCGMITRREAERLCKSFLGDNAPPRLPDDFAFSVHHECAWGCRGAFLPSRYNSSRAKCIKCTFCGLFFSPNKFIFHSHRTTANATYVQPDAANFNSWRRHMKLSGAPPDDVVHAWEDVKAMFNGGTRKRLLATSSTSSPARVSRSAAPIVNPSKQMKLDGSATSTYPTPASTPIPVPTPPRVPPFPDLSLPISMVDYVWHSPGGIKQFPFAPYAVPWLESAKRSVLGLSSLASTTSQQESLLQHVCSSNNSLDKHYHHSAFRPVFPTFGIPEITSTPEDHIKRHINSEEVLASKRRYLRELDRADVCSSVEYYGSDETGAHSPAESIKKENDSGCESYTHTTPRLTFKKESTMETLTDSDEVSKSPVKNRGKPECTDKTRLSLKPIGIDETMLHRYREFSPNLLEAISNLKTEDRKNGCIGYSVKAQRVFDGGCEGGRVVHGVPVTGREAHDEIKKKFRSDDEDESDISDDNGRQNEPEEEDGDDEPVDVETMDDQPGTGTAQVSTCQSSFKVFFDLTYPRIFNS